MLWISRHKIETMNEAWAKCPDGGWMRWALGCCRLSLFAQAAVSRALVLGDRKLSRCDMTMREFLLWEANLLRKLLQPKGGQP